MYKILDAELLKARFIEDRDVLRMFLQSFLVDLEKDLKELDQAVQTQKKDKIFFFAHKVKGLVSIFQIDSLTTDLLYLQNQTDAKDTVKTYDRLLENFNLLRKDIRLFLENEYKEKTKSVLLIDDNESYLKMQSELLTNRGFHVVSLSKPEDFLEVIQAHQIKVVLLDILMPQVDGLEVLKKIRTKFSKEHVSIIMLTSVEDKDVIDKTYILGANEFLNKSASIDLITLRLNLQFIALEHNFVLSKYQFLEEEHRQLKGYYQELNSPIMTLELGLEDLLASHKKNPPSELERMIGAVHEIERVVGKIKSINGI